MRRTTPPIILSQPLRHIWRAPTGTRLFRVNLLFSSTGVSVPSPCSVGRYFKIFAALGKNTPGDRFLPPALQNLHLEVPSSPLVSANNNLPYMKVSYMANIYARARLCVFVYRDTQTHSPKSQEALQMAICCRLKIKRASLPPPLFFFLSPLPPFSDCLLPLIPA